jgi:glutamyl-tRNA synthetase
MRIPAVEATKRGGELTRPVVGRLAPSPTGALHLGNARSFLLAWLSARAQRGQVLLRIEDIDSPRVKPWAVAATVEDLNWLGLDWDNVGEHWVQTERLERYRQVLEELQRSGRIYACTCTRSEVAEAASAPHESPLLLDSATFLVSAPHLEGPLYPGTCRQRTAPPQPTDATSFAYRWHLADEALGWNDQLLGPQSANPCRQLGDFVIARSNGIPAYQLAVIVDDRDQGISEVVRGNDLVPSTYRQLSILQALGWGHPVYAHVPLVVGPDGRRLAKRHGDTRLSWFRNQGVSPQALVGYLAWTAGLIDRIEPVSPRELIGSFRWSDMPRDAITFDLASDFDSDQKSFTKRSDH